MKPFLKWAGGKRWLVANDKITFPSFSGRYIEPFLGGGAVFFHLRPSTALLSDINPRLIEVYQALRHDWLKVEKALRTMQRLHGKKFYYEERKRRRRTLHGRAAQFLYLNRACWNGLYRENVRGEFNVPIGTKTKIIFEDEDFSEISNALQFAEVVTCDFEESIKRAGSGDLIFADPPYTAAHNMNGFVKYNQRIFRWEDQVRLRNAIGEAVDRGALVVLTNADHASVHELYSDLSRPRSIQRPSIISGDRRHRRPTTESLYFFGPHEA